MLDEFLKDPSKVSVVVLLLGAVAAFLMERVIPIGTHTKIVAGKDSQIEKLEAQNDELRVKLYKALDIMERTQQVRSEGMKNVG